MGGGNGQKSAMARAKKQAKEAAAGKASSSEDRKKHEATKTQIQCTICLQGFMGTAREPELQQHLDSKHPKAGATLATAFPAFTGVTPA